MLNIDRHIAIWAGWIAGPAFGVAMMAAPEYLHLGPTWSAILFWGGIIVFLMTIVVVGALSLHEQKRRRAVLGPVFLMSLGIVIFGIGAAWYFQPTKAQQSGELQSAELAPFDNFVQINCEIAQLPTVLPQNKMLELRLYHPGIVAGGTFISYPMSPGSPIETFKDEPSYAWLCRVSNFGASSVINVEAEIVVNFRTSGMVSDEVIYSGKVATPLMNLSSNGGTCEIYVRNFAPDHFAEVLLPATASGQMVGNAQRQTFKLASAMFGGFILPPFKQDKPQPADVPIPRPRPG
ncbi:MAG TPA: hypothetical protein VKP67_16385 [Xanthobacteraceae bacterium]|nr:hypothetical protein [Xanthobacteraceae bacterium]